MIKYFLIFLFVMVSSLFSIPFLPAIPPKPAEKRPDNGKNKFTLPSNQEVEVHALPTGTVTIKQCHHSRCLKENRHYVARFFAILLDRRFAPPMPVYTYLIKHPEGVFLIDTGTTPKYNDNSSWSPDPIGRRMVHSFIRLDCEKEETIMEKVEKEAKLKVSDVSAIILTHQHVDHTGGVPGFPNADVWTTKAEDDVERKIGGLHWRWRNKQTEKKIRYVDVEGTNTETGPLKGRKSVQLTKDGSVTLFHTPGHTPGSVSILLKTQSGEVWFTGDTSFTLAGMDPTQSTAGIHFEMENVRALQKTFKQMIDENPKETLILPSHDWEAAKRLEEFGLI